MNVIDKLSEAVGLLRANIVCPICLDHLTNAVSTRCNHHFCSECYNKLISINRNAFCPMCHSKVSRRSIMKNTMLDKMVIAVSDLLNSLKLDTGIDFTKEVPPPRSTHEATCSVPVYKPQKGPQDTNPEQHEEIGIVGVNKSSKLGRVSTKRGSLKKINKECDLIIKEDFREIPLKPIECNLNTERDFRETLSKLDQCNLNIGKDSKETPSKLDEINKEDKGKEIKTDKWLERYEKHYPGRRPNIQLDETILFPAEIIHPTKNKKRHTDLDVSKVTPVVKVQKWLDTNEDDLQESENMSIMNGSLPQRITVTADVHNSRSDDDFDELLSVSQLPPKETVINVPRTVNYAILGNTDTDEIETLEEFPPCEDKKKKCTSKAIDKTELKENEAKDNVTKPVTSEVDPYVFISSQKSQNNVEKNKRKSQVKRKSTKKSKQPLWKDISMYIKETYSHKQSRGAAKVTEASFFAPVSINDTFDNLLARTLKPQINNDDAFDNLLAETCKLQTSLKGGTESNTKEVNDNLLKKEEKIHSITKEGKAEDVCIFKSQTDAIEEWKATPETLDFSAGSDEEWGETMQKKRKPPSKVKKVFKAPVKRKTRSKRRQSKESIVTKEEEDSILESINHLFNEIDNHKLLTGSQADREALTAANDPDGNQFTHDINSSGIKQPDDLPEAIGGDKVQEYCTENVSKTNDLKSSPGWSHLAQLKKDFKGPKKPTLKALNVSVGTVKRNVSFVDDDVSKQVFEVQTPLLIDDESTVGDDVGDSNNKKSPCMQSRAEANFSKDIVDGINQEYNKELVINKHVLKNTSEMLMGNSGNVDPKENKHRREDDIVAERVVGISTVTNTYQKTLQKMETEVNSAKVGVEQKCYEERTINTCILDGVRLTEKSENENLLSKVGGTEKVVGVSVVRSVNQKSPRKSETEPNSNRELTCEFEQECVNEDQNSLNHLQAENNDLRPEEDIRAVEDTTFCVIRNRTDSDCSGSSCELIGYSNATDIKTKAKIMNDIIMTLESEIISGELIRQSIDMLPQNIRNQNKDTGTETELLTGKADTPVIVPESEDTSSSQEKIVEGRNVDETSTHLLSKISDSCPDDIRDTISMEIIPDSVDPWMDSDNLAGICKTPALNLNNRNNAMCLLVKEVPYEVLPEERNMNETSTLLLSKITDSCPDGISDPIAREVIPDSVNSWMDTHNLVGTTPALNLNNRNDVCVPDKEVPHEMLPKRQLVPFMKLGTVRRTNRARIAQFIVRGPLAPKRKRYRGPTAVIRHVLSQQLPEYESQPIPWITWGRDQEEGPLLKRSCLESTMAQTSQKSHLQQAVVAQTSRKLHPQQTVKLQTSQNLPLQQSVGIQTSQKLPLQQSVGIQTSQKIHSQQAVEVQTSQKVHSQRAVEVQTSQKVHSQRAVEVQTSQKVHSQRAVEVQTSQKVHSQRAVEVQTSQKLHSQLAVNVQTSPSLMKVTTVDYEVQVPLSCRTVEVLTSPSLFVTATNFNSEQLQKTVEVQTTQSLNEPSNVDSQQEEEEQIRPSFLDIPFESATNFEDVQDVPVTNNRVSNSYELVSNIPTPNLPNQLNGENDYDVLSQTESITDNELQLAGFNTDERFNNEDSTNKDHKVENTSDQQTTNKVNRQLKFNENFVPCLSADVDDFTPTAKSVKNFKRIRPMSSSESSDECEANNLKIIKKGKMIIEGITKLEKAKDQVIEIESDSSEPDMVNLISNEPDPTSENFIPGTYESCKSKKVKEHQKVEEEEDEDCLDSEELLQKIMDNIDEDLGIITRHTSPAKKKKSNLIVMDDSEDDVFKEAELEKKEQTPSAQSTVTITVKKLSSSQKTAECTLHGQFETNTDVQNQIPTDSIVLEESSSENEDVVEATPQKRGMSSTRSKSSSLGGKVSPHRVTEVVDLDLSLLSNNHSAGIAIPLQQTSVTTPRKSLVQVKVQSTALICNEQQPSVISTPPQTKKHSKNARYDAVQSTKYPQNVNPTRNSPQKLISSKPCALERSENSPKPDGGVMSPRRSARISPRKRCCVAMPATDKVQARPGVIQPVVFVCSGLIPSLIVKVKALAKIVGARFSETFVFEMTHLIVKVDENKAAEKTLKYLQAVAAGKWVVSYAWIGACMEAQRLVPEDEYEAVDSMGFDGPHRSRTRTAPLFKDFQFCCIPPFSIIATEKLQEILMLCGGSVAGSPREFSKIPNTFAICVIETDTVSSEETYGRWLEQYGVVSVGSDWVLDCVGSYHLFSLWPYLMFSASRERLLALGYSEEMLQSEDEDDGSTAA